MNWLVKEEPTHYSFDDLVRDGRTAWIGVRNPLAQKHLQSMREAFVQLQLQRVVPGFAVAIALIDRRDRRRDPEVGPACLHRPGAGIGHVDVVASEEVRSAGADIADIE